MFSQNCSDLRDSVLNSQNKNILQDMSACTACHACYNICAVKAVKMIADTEGFLYP